MQFEVAVSLNHDVMAWCWHHFPSVGMDEVLNLWLLWWWWCGNNVYVRSVRKILFSDTHSDVCSYEHLPRNNFRRMNVLVPTSYTYFILRLKCANFNAKFYLQKKYPNHTLTSTKMWRLLQFMYCSTHNRNNLIFDWNPFYKNRYLMIRS